MADFPPFCELSLSFVCRLPAGKVEPLFQTDKNSNSVFRGTAPTATGRQSCGQARYLEEWEADSGGLVCFFSEVKTVLCACIITFKPAFEGLLPAPLSVVGLQGDDFGRTGDTHTHTFIFAYCSRRRGLIQNVCKKR